MVIVYSDNKKVMLELLNGAQTLAKDLKTKLTAINTDDAAQAKEYISYGADHVITIESKDNQYQAETIANILKQTAFLRPKMKSKRVRGLYFTGQLTVPGPGVPPSLISGNIVSKMIMNDLNK